MYSCNSVFQSKPSVVIRKPDYPYKQPTDDAVVVAPTPEDDISGDDNSGVIDVMPATLELQINQVLKTAESYTGTKHRLGGLSKKGIDCSGLVLMSYKSIDLALPRSTGDQVKVGKSVSKKDLREGDLVFFTFPGGQRITHVGIVSEVAGPDNVVFIHTSTSRGVRKDNLYSTYWKPLLVKSRRVLE